MPVPHASGSLQILGPGGPKWLDNWALSRKKIILAKSADQFHCIIDPVGSISTAKNDLHLPNVIQKIEH